MPSHLADLKQIVSELKGRDFALALTDFTHYDRSYFVLIKRYTDGKPEAEKYALARLEFILRDDTSICKQWPANSGGLLGDPRDIREFFGIPYREGGVGDALQTLYQQLGGALLGNLRTRLNPEEQKLAVTSLSRSDSQSPDRLYCFTARRNPVNTATGAREQRSPFNSQKTALLRPELYGLLKDDRGVSFSFSKDPSREKTDREILESFNGM